jgi:hypothetical protein
MFEATGWVLEENVADGIATDELVLAYVRPPLATSPSPKRADSMLSISDESQESDSHY